ncbi:MAG: SURF1 family protein, partial [Phyllobacterium sp.]
PETWAGINARDDAYRHVRMEGGFLEARETLVKAVTARGEGFWVLAPFQTRQGFVILVNRGFVPADAQKRGWNAADPRNETSLTGLLRITEPGGGFLRSHDPAAGRWYSRDVAAIAAARGIGPVAPYFVDADAKADRNALPVGGLTVIAFANNHLVYASTWFAMAAMLGAAAVLIGRSEWRARRAAGGSAP